MEKTIVLILLVLFIGGCASIEKPEGKYKKVIVLGIDGMEPKIIDALIDDLPNLKNLSQSGTYSRLGTSYPPHSPVAWTSIATGVNPGKHNIFDFISRDPESYIPKLSLAGSHGAKYFSYVKSDPFWRITTKNNVPTTIIRWPVSFPPERVEGNLLSGLGVPDVKGFLSGYSIYAAKDIRSDKPSNKIFKVEVNNKVINTEVSGPKTASGDVTVPMQIKLSDGEVYVHVQGTDFVVKENGWSSWIRAKFKIGMFKSVYGIFRVYVSSIEPFEMYMTAIQIDPVNPLVDISYPDSYSADLAEDIGPYYTLGMPEETDGFMDGRLTEEAFNLHISQIEDERTKMFEKEFAEFQKKDSGVLAFVYDSSDRVQHVFWDDRLDDDEYTINKHVRNYYIAKDQLIGEILEKIDDNTLLLVISDHGFTSFDKGVSINTWLLENGFLTLRSDIPKGEDGALFQYVDWEKTKAYSLGFNSLYINVKGREADGIVEDREEIVDEIVEKLESYQDEGKRVVNKAYQREDIYNGPLLDEAPDIIIGFNPGYRMSWQTAVGGFTDTVIVDNDKIWKGDHLVDPKFVPGVLFSNIKINITDPNQMDIAPTVLDAVGIDVPENMDGKSLIR